ncbi:unnamed protein product [Cylindrotheca closterium]|uniref:Glycosyltransferase 61 catalytic domain-containing protein n=1 Tax=Cylindrotheca closterium TaxID=2856 RepID=A0AAD2FSP1_9STRA|nr:unnamed protein product [Cylindrotheca closterium]
MDEELTWTWKLVSLRISVLLIAMALLADIEFSFNIKNTATTLRGHSTNKTLDFRRHYWVRAKVNRTENATINAVLQDAILSDSRGRCIPGPNQPLAKLHHTRNPLDEPRIDPSEAAAVREVACDFHGRSDAHFPHAMQQLYRCFSYWQDYHTKVPYLLMPTGKVEQKLSNQPFIAGMLDMFEYQMDVGIIMKDIFNPKALDDLIKQPHVDMQAFNLVGNFSLRHAYHLHHYAKKEFELNDTSTDTCKHSKPRIAILNRAPNSRRTMLNAEHIANMTDMKELSRNNTVEVAYFEGLDVRDQIGFFRSVDILISPHGAQLTGVAFMNAPCSHVLELFPKAYSLPGFFGSLAIESGKDYSYFYMSENPPEAEQAHNKTERNHARAQDLCPSTDVMVDTIRKLVDEWRQCCNVRCEKRDTNPMMAGCPSIH